MGNSCQLVTGKSFPFKINKIKVCPVKAWLSLTSGYRVLVSVQSIIQTELYPFLVSCSGISKEHHSLCIGKCSNGLIQLKVECSKVQVENTKTASIACLIVDTPFCFQIQVNASLVGPYLCNGGG